MPIDTDGNRTIIVESILPKMDEKRRSLIEVGLANEPWLLYTPNEGGGGLPLKTIAFAAVIGLGLVLLFRR